MEFTVYPMFVLSKVILYIATQWNQLFRKMHHVTPVAPASCSFKKYKILLPDELCRPIKPWLLACVKSKHLGQVWPKVLCFSSLGISVIGLATICWGQPGRLLTHVSFIMRRNSLSVKLKITVASGWKEGTGFISLRFPKVAPWL